MKKLLFVAVAVLSFSASSCRNDNTTECPNDKRGILGDSFEVMFQDENGNDISSALELTPSDIYDDCYTIALGQSTQIFYAKELENPVIDARVLVYKHLHGGNLFNFGGSVMYPLCPEDAVYINIWEFTCPKIFGHDNPNTLTSFITRDTNVTQISKEKDHRLFFNGEEVFATSYDPVVAQGSLRGIYRIRITNR